MNTERRLAMLEAFAKSKGYEFQGFRVRWLEQHPELEEPVVQIVEPEVAEELEPESVDLPDETSPTVEIVEEKPKRKRRKAKDADA